MCICCGNMRSAIGSAVVKSRGGKLWIGRPLTYYELSYCPFCGRKLGGMEQGLEGTRC